MKNIDSFIKGKLKSKKMRVDDFIKETEMSKSTIYRVMKGIQKPSEELIEKIALVLNLNQLEKNELIYYSNISTNSENTSEVRSEEHTSELQSRQYLVCRLLLEKQNKNPNTPSLQISHDT